MPFILYNIDKVQCFIFPFYNKIINSFLKIGGITKDMRSGENKQTQKEVPFTWRLRELFFMIQII